MIEREARRNVSVTISVLDELLSGYRAPDCSARGSVHSSIFRPNEGSLWCLRARLAPGSSLHWSGRQGDQVLYVLEGSLDAAGQNCGAGTAVVVEAGLHEAVRANTASYVVHFGTTALQNPNRNVGHRGLHVIEEAEMREPHGSLGNSRTRFFLDGTFASCPLALMLVDASSQASSHKVGSHSHTEDEILYLLAGELQFGRSRILPGMCVAVPHGTLYGFTSPGSYKFLNFRGATSMSTFRGLPPILETVAGLADAYNNPQVVEHLARHGTE